MKRSGSFQARLMLILVRGLGRVGQVGSIVGVDMGSVPFPRPQFDAVERRAHEAMRQLLLGGDGGVMGYTSSYPKHRFLDYLVSECDVVLHGSNGADIEIFEPRESNDLDTRCTAVFAAADGVLPMFYATINRSSVRGLFNTCYWAWPGLRRWFYLAVAADPDADQTWCTGYVYVLPRVSFRRGHGTEVLSFSSVRPHGALEVTPEDFPLRDVVARFAMGNSVPDTLRSIQARRDLRSR